jgi:cell division protein FtsW
MGICLLAFCRHLPYRMLRPLAYPLLALALVLLIAVLISPLGLKAGGSTRWMRLGPFNFQPSELARFALVAYLAASMSRKQGRIQEFSIGFLPHVIVLALLCGLILLQPDFGSAVILTSLTWIMLFAGGVRLSHLASALAVAAPLLAYVAIQKPYRLQRLLVFTDPWRDPAGDGYQMTHALMAFGSGQMWGAGIGQGMQKLFYLPEPHTDFIFAVIGEELGLVGVGAILLLYAMIIWRGYAIARAAAEPFGALLATGLTTALALQVTINISVTLGLLPTKGLTLPFLSYGGTSLLMSMATVGVLLNIGATR